MRARHIYNEDLRGCRHIGIAPDEGWHLQSGLWKQWKGTRAGAAWLAGVALAFIVVSGPVARAQAVTNLSSAEQGVPTETQLQVESSLSGGRIITTFTMHVEPTGGEANADGVVTVVDGAHEIGSVKLDGDGNARLQTDALPPGTHLVHAIYSGNAASGNGQLAGSLSAVKEVALATTGVPDFSVTPASTSLSVVQGSAISTILTLAPINGFNGYVTLSCSGLTPNTACTFVPVDAFVGNGTNSSSTLSVTTQGGTGPNAQLRRHTSLVYAILFPGLLALAGVGLRARKAWQHIGLILFIIAGVGLLNGCAQRYHYLNRPPLEAPGTALGTTTFILEEQSISGTTVITHQTSMTLTVTAPSS